MKKFKSPTTPESNDLDVAGLAPSRRKLLGGGLAVVASGALLSACGPGASAAGGVGNFPKTPKYRITFVNHSTTNSFFVPTRYGAEDAGAAFNCDVQWTGSADGDTAEMVTAVNSAIDAKVDGIAISMPNPTAFTKVIDRAVQAGIPVVGYSVDASGNQRLAYIGSDDRLSGARIGDRGAELLGGSGKVAAFAAEPGSTYVTARLDGLTEALRAGGITGKIGFAKTGFTVGESISSVAAYIEGNPDVTGLFGLDAYATQAIGKVVADKKLSDKVVAAGFDTLEPTLKSVENGALKFTIDSSSYLQGFYPVSELYLYLVSGGITGAADINTGVRLVDAKLAKVYLSTPTRFQGTAKTQKLVKAS